VTVDDGNVTVVALGVAEAIGCWITVIEIVWELTSVPPGPVAVKSMV